MELFPDKAFVRLRNRTYGTYLYADDDGAGVVLKPHRASLQTAWKVHRVLLHDRIYILLHSTAYGRYLAFSCETSWVDPIHQANHTIQGVYENPEQDDVIWEAAYVDNVYVVILQPSQRVLRASMPNTPFFGYTFVENDQPGNYYGTMIHWMVEAIPARLVPPPTVMPHLVPTDGVNSEDPSRRILYMRADAYGYFNPRTRGSWLFHGNSLWQLTADLARLLNEPTHRITLCVRAGSQGRLTPLVIDLPSNPNDMEIVVLTTMSPANLALRHPGVDAQ